MKRLGLVVNPIAGLGGRVGLKGTDGADTVRRALELGAVPEAPSRAVQALRRLERIGAELQILTYAGAMGESEAQACGFEPAVVGSPHGAETTAEDTRAAARAMAEEGVDLLVFAGGDGTARDVCDAIGGRVPVVGVPAGVKIHSAVFANSPTAAGDLAAMFLASASRPLRIREAEVMDIDEEAFRENRLSARLYGYLRVPYERALLQGAKTGSAPGDEVALDGIASDVINDMDDERLYVIGPGTTTRAIMEKLGLPNTLLGVDAVRARKLAGSDLPEADLLRLIGDDPAAIVVSPIGGQGHVFGRGNQQISPAVIERVGPENVVVVATRSKLLSLEGRPLLVDTGDENVDRALEAYVKVVTGLNEAIPYRVASGA